MFSYLQPLVLATPIALGGLGLDAPTIGLILGFNGIIVGVVQVMFFAPLHRRLGTKTAFMAALAAYFGVYLSWPLMSFLAQRAGKIDASVVLILALQQLISAFSGLGVGESRTSSIAYFFAYLDDVTLNFLFYRLRTYFDHECCSYAKFVGRDNRLKPNPRVSDASTRPGRRVFTICLFHRTQSARRPTRLCRSRPYCWADVGGRVAFAQSDHKGK